jgi:hypothetical protein
VKEPPVSVPNDEHAAIVQQPDHAHEFGERLGVGQCVARRRRVDPRFHRIATRADRQVRDVIGGARRHLSIAVEHEVLEDAHRRVDRLVTFHHQVDGVLHLGAVQIERGHALQRREPEQRARVFSRPDHPSQRELVDVRDFVEARLDHLIGRRERGHVAGDAHPEAMCLLDHRRHPRRIHAVVALDLPVAARAVPANRVERLFLAIYHDAVVGAELALAFDETRADHVRPRDLSRIDLVDQRVEHRVVVAHVAHGGDAGQHIEQRVVLAQMRVHLVHARDQRAARRIDRDFARRRATIYRLHRRNLLAADHHAHGRRQRAGLRIEQPHVADARRRAVIVRDLTLNRGVASRVPVGGERAQPHLFAFVTFAHHHRFRRHYREEIARCVEQHRVGHGLNARKVVARDLQGATFAVDANRVAFLQRQRAAGKRVHFQARLLEQGARVDLQRPRAAHLRDVDRRLLE